MDKNLEEIKKSVEHIGDLESQIILLEEKKKEIEKQALLDSTNFIVNFYRINKGNLIYKYCLVLNEHVNLDVSIKITPSSVGSKVISDVTIGSLVPFAIFKRLTSEADPLSTSTDYIVSREDITKVDILDYLSKSKEHFVKNFNNILIKNSLEHNFGSVDKGLLLEEFNRIHITIENLFDVNNARFKSSFSKYILSKSSEELLKSFINEKSKIFFKNKLNEELILEDTKVTPKVKI